MVYNSHSLCLHCKVCVCLLKRDNYCTSDVLVSVMKEHIFVAFCWYLLTEHLIINEHEDDLCRLSEIREDFDKSWFCYYFSLSIKAFKYLWSNKKLFHLICCLSIEQIWPQKDVFGFFLSVFQVNCPRFCVLPLTSLAIK